MDKQKRITLAKIAGPHGVKGLVKILPFGEDTSLLETLPVYTADGAPVKITLKNRLGKFILAEVDTVKTREDAEKAGGTELCVPADSLPDIEEDGGFYYHELTGKTVMDEAGTHIGTVIAVENFGASDLLEIKTAKGSTFYLPFTDDFAPVIADTITIRNFEDFL